MSRVRKEVVWSIKRSLFKLSGANLYQIAKDIATDSSEIEELSATDEEECTDYIISYMQSGALLGSEDEGVGELLMLNDVIGRMIVEAELAAAAKTPVGTNTSPTPPPSDHTSPPPSPNANNATMPSHPHSNPPVNATAQPVEDLRMLYEELGEKLRQWETTASSPASTQNTPERVVPLKDLPYFQRREFKVHGGQIGDQSSEVSYGSISKQIDEGVREGFADAEVVRGVLRIIKTGTFRDMLSNKDDLAIPELKVFLRSHLGEKATTEMFQELMCARQAEQESPQQFLYRMIGLKQRLLFQSKQADTDISYDPKTIQEVFLNTIYQGLGAKHAELRQRLRPLVSNNQVTDEEILGQMTKMISDENEHQRRLGQLPRQKPSHAHSAKVEADGQHDDKPRGSAADGKNLQTIQQLSAQVETLTQMVATLMDHQTAPNHVISPFPLTLQPRPSPAIASSSIAPSLITATFPVIP
ncbi:hypothetical protein N1851_012231 [Merluccius polli]|uniref:Uncharacterized protein n=1 Tax=Merluccius polli TaxID=89951 RepID=A0AA47MWM8_MERPO|nr:hypothetical protein N1851_012231 [Merluccius polli]